VEYDGRGQCYLEFGHQQVARVDVKFVSGQPPTGSFDAPSVALAREKSDFGSTRARRWFGREWAP
jgi:sulfide:quinone oxidoreductase